MSTSSLSLVPSLPPHSLHSLPAAHTSLASPTLHTVHSPTPPQSAQPRLRGMPGRLVAVDRTEAGLRQLAAAVEAPGPDAPRRAAAAVMGAAAAAAG